MRIITPSLRSRDITKICHATFIALLVLANPTSECLCASGLHISVHRTFHALCAFYLEENSINIDPWFLTRTISHVGAAREQDDERGMGGAGPS